MNERLVAGGNTLDVLLGHPRHHGAKTGARLFDLMLFAFLEELVVFLQATLVLAHPLLGELAGLNLFENLFHLGLGVLVDDARTTGDVTILGGLGNRETHSRDTGLIHEVANELQLM